MDEYVGLPRNHPESYHSFMFTNLFKYIDIDPNNVHILDGNANDLNKECQDFERKIKEAGGIELFVGGHLFSFYFNGLLILILPFNFRNRPRRPYCF